MKIVEFLDFKLFTWLTNSISFLNRVHNGN